MLNPGVGLFPFPIVPCSETPSRRGDVNLSAKTRCLDAQVFSVPLIGLLVDFEHLVRIADGPRIE